MTDSIYVTLGQAQLKEKSYRTQVENFLKCDGENMIFIWRFAIKPKKPFVWVYICVGNKVRWRARFVSWDERSEIEVNEGTKILKGDHLAILIDFEKLPRPYEIRKGFQGFRYK